MDARCMKNIIPTRSPLLTSAKSEKRIMAPAENPEHGQQTDGSHQIRERRNGWGN